MGDYDVAVIGAGPGGYVAAIRAAQLGGKVALVEREEVGGTCLNKGCIPTKALITAAELYSTIRTRAEKFGVVVHGSSLDPGKVMERKNYVVKRLTAGVRYLLRSRKIDLFPGNGALKSPTEVEVTDAGGKRETLITKHVIIATGSSVAPLPVKGSELALSTDDILEINRFPQSIIVVGGGAAGAEFATMFAGFGSQVTLMEMMPQLLPGEDREIAEHLAKSITKQGVRVLLNARVIEISDPGNGNRRVRAQTPSGEVELEAEMVLAAAGRKPNSEGIGLEKLGVATSKGRILVNERMETNVKGVYAVGDVVGISPFAHVASAEGVVAAENAMGSNAVMDYKATPRCIFTLPEVAAVGLTEEKARGEGRNVKVGRFPFTANGRALTLDETDGLVKVIADSESGEVLGLHIIGPSATELIPEGVLAINGELTVNDVANVIHAHPTLMEAVKEAFLDVRGEAIHR